MLFEKSDDGYKCAYFDHCTCEDEPAGFISISMDGYYRFYPEEGIALCAGDLKMLMKKVADLNIAVR